MFTSVTVDEGDSKTPQRVLVLGTHERTLFMCGLLNLSGYPVVADVDAVACVAYATHKCVWHLHAERVRRVDRDSSSIG